jgi:membrane protein insertase Oxa1/YidC/SpoIIIJ
LREAGEGKQAEQSDLNGAIGRSMRFLLPTMIFIFTISIASALSLYWLVSGIVAYIQQSIVLGRDEEEMEALADAKPRKKAVKDIPEAEIVSKLPTKTAKKSAKSAKRKKRRK